MRGFHIGGKPFTGQWDTSPSDTCKTPSYVISPSPPFLAAMPVLFFVIDVIKEGWWSVRERKRDLKLSLAKEKCGVVNTLRGCLHGKAALL